MIASHRRAAALFCGGLLLIPFEAAHTAPSRDAPRSAYAPGVSPEAVQALRDMSDYMRTVADLEVRATTERQLIDAHGRSQTLMGDVAYKVRWPNNFRIRSNENGRTRELVYDGKTLTVFTPNSGYYAQVAAPQTIAPTLALAADRYDINPPLVDLFRWGDGDAGTRMLTSAQHVGETLVDGVRADEYAYQQPGRAWRIWIARGGQALPVRVSVTSLGQSHPLTYTAHLAWITNSRFADNSFTFQPPAGSRLIGITAMG